MAHHFITDVNHCNKIKKLYEPFSGVIIGNTIRITIDCITPCHMHFMDVRDRLYYC